MEFLKRNENCTLQVRPGVESYQMKALLPRNCSGMFLQTHLLGYRQDIEGMFKRCCYLRGLDLNQIKRPTNSSLKQSQRKDTRI